MSGREVIQNVPNGVIPEVPACQPQLRDLMLRSWSLDPYQRPSFSEARLLLATECKWEYEEATDESEYIDVSGFSEDLEHGMVYFNRRVSELECEI